MHRTLILGVVAGMICFGSFGSATASGPTDAQTVVFTSADYRFTTDVTGPRVEMDGFGNLMAPGKPMLPAKTFLVLLPPGARAVSLDVAATGAKEISGTHLMSPTPPMIPLTLSSGLAERVWREWDESYEATYGSDRAYPEAVATIVGSGTLRKYSYVAISFRPFSYHPRSRRLVHHDGARVQVHYRVPAPGSAEERFAAELRWDTIADGRAEKLFVNHAQMKGWYEPSGPPTQTPASHDYVIITHAGALGAVTASSFTGWKTSLGYDVATVLITDDEITGQPGRDLGERIRNFLRTSYGTWGIRYVLLVGNWATVPMRYCHADPGDHTHNPSSPSAAGGSVPTDHYYADLSLPDDESWDLDGDGFYGEYGQDAPDFLTEVAVGRIPTNNAPKITYALDKLVRFEQDTGSWKSCGLHGGAILFYENQDFMDIPFRDGAVCLDLIEADCMTGWPMERLSEQSGLSPSTYPWLPLSQDTFGSVWRNGRYGVVNWAGHGSPDGAWRVIWDWDDGDGIPETDGSDGFSHDAFVADWVALEDDHPSIVFAVSCNVGYPELNSQGRLGVDLLTKSTVGASAGVVSASRVAAVTRDWPVTPGGAESICREFNRHLIAGPGGAMRVGDALYDAKYYCHANYGWDNFLEFWNLYDYNLYGDPSLEWQGIDQAAVGTPLAEVSRADRGPSISPNPFVEGTEISYELAADGWVRAEVLDVRGRRVAVLIDEYQVAGPKRARWNGRSSGGDQHASGIYFVRIRTAEGTASRTVVLLR